MTHKYNAKFCKSFEELHNCKNLEDIIYQKKQIKKPDEHFFFWMQKVKNILINGMEFLY